MNAEVLLKHFDRISDAPDAVPRLRQFILDLAVRGKLVEQDPAEEPAAAIVKRIKLEKVDFAQSGEFTPKQISVVTDAEVGFDLPNGWCSTRLGYISRRIQYGFTASAVRSATDVRLLRITDIQNNSVAWETVPGCDISASEVTQYRLRMGDILIARTGGTIGKSFLIRDTPVCAVFASYLIRVQASSEIFDQYLKLFVESPLYWKQLREGSRGTGQPNVNGQTLGQLVVVVPPRGEQHRIVAKVDELMALCDRLEEAQRERGTRRERLTVASITNLTNSANGDDFRQNAQFFIDHLPKLTAQPAQIHATRQAILDLAVRGFLVPQDPDDVPAWELLVQLQHEKARLIKQGKIKKHKPLPAINESHRLLPLPSGWCWVRLGDVCQVVTSGSRDWAKFYASDGPAIFLRMGNLSRGSYQLRLGNIQRVNPPLDSEGARTRLEEGDVLLSITGEVGMLGLIPPNFGDAYINQHTCLVRPMADLRNRYLPELFRAPFAQVQFNAPQRGIKNSFRLTDVTEFLVPLPPLAEQGRIVAKIDQLMAYCDQLESQLITTQARSLSLLEAVLHESLGLTSD